MTRHDMLVELVTDQINSIEQMIRDDEYNDVHRWLHPILLRELKLDYADWTDEQLQDYYNDQLGVDTPSSPPLSSGDGQKENAYEIHFQTEEDQRRSLSNASGVDSIPLSLFRTIRDASSVGEVAAEGPVPPAGEAPVHWY